jgi:hypothetical protein
MSLLKDVYGVLFSPEFAELYDERRHIWLERMDLQWNIKEVIAWIEEDRVDEDFRRRFCLSHMNSTKGVFEWNFKESDFNRKDSPHLS